MPYRIGIGGIAIESGIFSPPPRTRADCTILRGEELVVPYPFLLDPALPDSTFGIRLFGA